MEAAERIKAAREKSLRLMRMDSKMDAFVKGNRGSINENIESPSAQLVMEQPQEPRVNTKPLLNRGRLSESAANIPREILESFQNNVIDESQLLDGVMGDGNSLSMLTEGIPTKRQQQPSSMPREITEAYGTPQQQAMNVAQSQVDYPMIRMIVEEVVKKYASALQKKVLSESANRSGEVGAIMLGKTLKLLDKQGNVYEAVLKKVSNLNENKK